MRGGSGGGEEGDEAGDVEGNDDTANVNLGGGGGWRSPPFTSTPHSSLSHLTLPPLHPPSDPDKDDVSPVYPFHRIPAPVDEGEGNEDKGCVTREEGGGGGEVE